MRAKKCISLIIFFSFTYILNADNLNINNDSIRAYYTYKNAATLIGKNKFSEAIDSLKISLSLREKLYSKQSYKYAIAQNALGISYKNLGFFDKSLEHFIKAEEAQQASNKINHPALARLYNNIGNVYKSKLNYGKAHEYYQKAINTYQHLNGKYSADIADVYYNISDNYYRQFKYKEALKTAKNNYSCAYGDTKLYFLDLKAASYKELQQIPEAYKSYNEAIDYAINFYSSTDLNVIFEYLNFAKFLISVNDFIKAKEMLDAAKVILDNSYLKKGLIILSYYKALGAYYSNLNIDTKDLTTFRSQKTLNLNHAISSYKHGLDALGMDIYQSENISIEKTLSLTQSIELLKLIADTYTIISDIYSGSQDKKEQEPLTKAIEYYTITSKLIQQARKEMYSDQHKILLNELEQATFYKIVQTAYKAYKTNPNPQIIDFAFNNAENMKASSVFDRLSDQLAKKNSIIPDSLTELERTINYCITNKNESLFNLKHSSIQNSTLIASIDSSLFQLKKQRDELNQYLEKNYPDYYKLKYTNKTISTKEIQNQLQSNEVLFEYVYNETDSIPNLYVFSFTKDSVKFNRLNTDIKFSQCVKNIFQFISNPDYQYTHKQDIYNFCYDSHYLYNTLFSPFRNKIKNKKITIIPDGKLSYIPFDALLTEMPDSSSLSQLNKLPYLIKKNTINYAYSSSLLFKFNKQQRKAKYRLLAFAPKYNSETIIYKDKKYTLTPLPGVEKEVELISKLIKSDNYCGDNATEKNFKKNCSNFDILHLAMHAFINDSMPAFSRFAFSQQETDQENDGWLNTADIYNLNLNSRLTVLSACNTGRGNLKKGEGIMSLARGFLYAGCPNIVMTLWEVEDHAGTSIIHLFYKNLKKGKPAAEALRLAKLNYLENANNRLAHPHYWLGYVSIGIEQPLFKSYDFYFFLLVILAIAGITFDQIIRMRKTLKKRHSK